MEAERPAIPAPIIKIFRGIGDLNEVRWMGFCEGGEMMGAELGLLDLGCVVVLRSGIFGPFTGGQ